MKVELQIGDTITIPEGCKATIKGGSVVFEKEEKRVEKIRWRVEDGKKYYYVDNQGIVLMDTEDGHDFDKYRYKFNNYFRTEEQTREAARRIKETLRKYHEEIGE